MERGGSGRADIVVFFLLDNELNVILLTDIRASKNCEMTCPLVRRSDASGLHRKETP